MAIGFEKEKDVGSKEIHNAIPAIANEQFTFRPPTKSSQRGRPMLWRSANSSSPIPIAHLRTSLDGYSTKQGFNFPRLQVLDYQ